jgi:quinoprotein glucose dehydrogenase
MKGLPSVCVVSSAGALALFSISALSASAVSIWDGVYTDMQARRGASIYPVACGKCHGYQLNGAPDDPDMFSTPPIGGSKFLRDWEGRTLASLMEYTRTTMPANNPGFLSEQEFADVLAYMLYVSGNPAGAEEMSTDPRRLAEILIARQP